MRDERRTVNTKEEINASQLNLSWWQLGAMGLIAPKATMLWTPPGDDPAMLKHGRFTWDQVIYTDVELGNLPSYIASYVVNGVGDYTLTFENSVDGRPDEDGIPQTESLSFQFALGGVSLFAGGFRAFLEVTVVDPQTFDITVTRNSVPSHQPYTLMVF